MTRPCPRLRVPPRLAGRFRATVTALVLAALAGTTAECTDRRRPHGDTAAPSGDVTAVRPVPWDAGTADGGQTTVPQAWLRTVTVAGAATLDSTLRLRTAGADGVASRPGGGAPARDTVAPGAEMFPGDTVVTGPGGTVTVHPLVTTRGTPAGAIALAPESVLEVPGYGGAVAVLTRGVADVTAGVDPVRVDTPMGRVIVSGGSATVAVSGDGSVAVRSDVGVVTVWPSPAAPVARTTRLSPAEIARRRRATPDHPVLLDVDLPDLAAQAVRPVAARPLAPGEVLAWDALGDLHRHPPPPRAPRGSVVRWIGTLDASLAAPGAHLYAIAWLGRAGGGDLADARAAIARLRTGGNGLTPRERADLTSALSLALGRATARSRRGRDLAARGGDVTALVQVAPTEDVCEAARAVMPLEP